MDIIEKLIIDMLFDYKIKANRDRFMLSLEKDINYFIDFVDKNNIN